MRAVILAGGRGIRLRPYTSIWPKPMMPVGDRPILEVLLRQLAAAGVEQATVMLGHLAYLIEGYIGDGGWLGLKVDYVRELEPLGTAGPLRHLAGTIDAPFIVANGDLLTDLDFGRMMAHHCNRGAAATVGTYTRHRPVDFGVLNVVAGRVYGYDEKPVQQHDLSMGVYVLNPQVLDRIPAGYYDMPQLVNDLVHAGQLVNAFQHGGRWVDIGRPEDYERVNPEEWQR